MKLEKIQKELAKKINIKCSSINSICEHLLKKYDKPEKMSHAEYAYFIYSYNIIYQTKDLLYLCKKLSLEKNNFDSSLYILSRSIVENFFYLSYLLSDINKIKERLEILTCFNSNQNIKHFKGLIKLSEKNKFIFSDDPTDMMSRHMMEEKNKEWLDYVNAHIDINNDSDSFSKEIQTFEHVEQICIKYDEVKNITMVEKGKESKSLEWMYNFIYRFQSMSVHQNLNSKEKVFSIYLNKKDTPNNTHILGLVCDILDQIIELNVTK